MTAEPPTADRTVTGSAETGPRVGEEYGTGGLRSLGGRVSWALVSEVVNLVGTALLFLVLAKRLAPEGYGALQAVIAVAAIGGPLASFGANWQLIRRTVISDDAAAEAGRAISVALIGTGSGAALLVVLAMAVPAALPDISRLTIALVLVAQMPAHWMVELAVTSAVARADLRSAAGVRVVAVTLRLAALGSFVFVGSASIDIWAWWFAAGNLASAVAAVALLARSLGRWPRLRLPPADEFTSGFPYGVGNATEGFLAASDRPLLKQYGHGTATGLYAAGYRVVTLGLVPLLALLKAQDRHFFRQGARGNAASHRAARTLSIHALAVTVPATFGLWLAAPLFEVAIGSAWAETGDVIRLLAVLPIVKGFQFSFGNALTAAGNQQTRMWLTGLAAAANLVGNVRYIPSGSWRAAVVTTLAAEVGLALAFAIASARSNRSRPGESR